ncbi:immunoglobulin-like domain-containing protein [Colwellia echini]|uniref:DUF5011 domain-containing protein n=1 Tax=Colwellia echini TaxID=1982103 RepID=A0ABY3MYT9_9GAMM|nr:immunoglobulin-like domain-containing protein [Colwellia echini]TYK66249.1 DUF5011 domain-containing protein [Colwellia echini]
MFINNADTYSNLSKKKWLSVVIASVLATGCNSDSDVNEIIDEVKGTDIVAPVITLEGSATVSLEYGSAYSESGATATDAVDGSFAATPSGEVDTNQVGSYTITYNATDVAGNSATAVSRTVNVVDSVSPVITLTGDTEVTLTVGDTYEDEGATATDNADDNLTVVVSGTVDPATAGTYTLTYNVSDASGNAAEALTRTVIVNAANITEDPEDVTAPTIVLLGAAEITIPINTDYSDAGATVTDDVDTDLEAVMVSTVDTTTVGTYTVTYNVTDAAGNIAETKTRTVIVSTDADVTAPVIALVGEMDVELTVGDTYEELGATVTDNVDANLDAVIDSTEVNSEVAGSYTVTYNVMDTAGNAAEEVVRNVTVIEASDTSSFITTWTVTDGDLSITIPTTFQIHPNTEYDYNVTWGDGASNDYTGTDHTAQHTYATAGTYTVTISGTFTQINFGGNHSPNHDKITSIEQWGDAVWTKFGTAFMGCANLAVNATDAPDLSAGPAMNAMFRSTPMNSPVGHWDVSTITNMANMFGDATQFDQDLSDWQPLLVNNFGNFMNNVTLSTANYDALLISWAELNVWDNITNFNAGDSDYSAAGQAARDKLTTEQGWAFIDGDLE